MSIEMFTYVILSPLKVHLLDLNVIHLYVHSAYEETTTDVKPELLSGVQTGNGIHMIDIILPMCAQTEKTTFSCKDD